MSRFKCLVLDVDGTTLDHEGRLGDEDVAAAHALASQGVQVTLCTGRLFTGTQWVARRLGVEGSIAVSNGSELIDVDGTLRYGAYLGREARLEQRERILEAGLSPLLFTSRGIRIGPEATAHIPYLSVWTPDVTVDLDWEREDVVAVSAVGDPDAIDGLRDRVSSERPELQVFRFATWHGEGFLEVRRPEDKASALRRLCAERGVAVEDTVAVGDWLNDISMLRAAGLGLAMGHADDRVQAAADEVLESGLHGGAVAEVAERLWGLVV